MQSTDQSAIKLTLQEVSSATSSYLDIDGVRIRYKASGVGEQVLLLHGWGGSIESMELVFDALAKSYNVFAIDFPGHGKSDLPPGPWAVSDYTDCLLRVMDNLGLRRPHIIAHSFGGRVTIRLAKFHPDRVNRIVLVDSAGIRPPRPPKYYFKIALAKAGKFLARYGGSIGQGIRNFIYSRIGSKDYAQAGPLRDTFIKVVNDDQTEMLSQVQSPTLLVWGADDKDTPLASAKIMEKLIPDASLVVFENAGHFSYIDHSHKFHMIVRKFLRGGNT
jgi:pimeloyl-ACP methyl ester carboxylesterase